MKSLINEIIKSDVLFFSDKTLKSFGGEKQKIKDIFELVKNLNQLSKIVRFIKSKKLKQTIFILVEDSYYSKVFTLCNQNTTDNTWFKIGSESDFLKLRKNVSFCIVIGNIQLSVFRRLLNQGVYIFNLVVEESNVKITETYLFSYKIDSIDRVAWFISYLDLS